MSDPVRRHYELYPYPSYPLLASVRRCDTYALNLTALWIRFNGELPPAIAKRILIAGCGSFAPYPFALSNPDVDICALDLSSRSLKRARLHCLLHGKRNLTFQCGDLLEPASVSSTYGLVDAFGVLHHLEDPLTGLKALAAQLVDGGILRIMLYSRYARRSEESIRRAFRLLGISDPARARKILLDSKPGSRLRRFLDTSWEVGTGAGLADALLHPCVLTYRIDELMALVGRSGLEPLMFAHDNALPDIDQEIERIRRLEACKESPGNFVLYLGRNVKGPFLDERRGFLVLNPCLRSALGTMRLGTLHIPQRLGNPNPSLGRQERSFLRRFTHPVPCDSLSLQDLNVAAKYKQSLFLLHYRQ